jgi:hypothetical protein
VIYPISNREQAVAVWPVVVGSHAAGLIQENSRYCFELRDVENPDSAELYVDDLPLEALRSPNHTTARWSWTPEFYVGQFRLLIRYAPAYRAELDLIVDPDISKLSRDEFDSMVRDILEDTTALFSLSGFRFGIAKGIGTNVPPLARLEFLRSRIAKVEQIVFDIDRRPVRVLSNEKVVRPLAAARSINARDVYTSFYKHRLQPAPPNFRIGRILVPALPTNFTVSAKTASQDIAENRAIKTCLVGWRSWLLAIADQLSDVEGMTDAARKTAQLLWSRRCQGLARRLLRLLQLPLFEDIADTPTRVSISPIFRRVPSYHRFLSLYRDINLGIAQIQGDFLNLPLSRTYDLYELWVFLRLCRAAAEKYGLDVNFSRFFEPDQSRLGIATLVEAPTLMIPAGIQLRFKRQYREFWRDAQNTGSLSRTMIPDISIEKTQPAPVIIVLDAKYRIGIQLNDALSSIHMYRDAIVRDADPDTDKIVIAAYLVTPHLPTLMGQWKDSEMPARLFYPAYRQRFRFGAVTLRPGGSLANAAEALDLVVSDAMEVSVGDSQ